MVGLLNSRFHSRAPTKKCEPDLKTLTGWGAVNGNTCAYAVAWLEVVVMLLNVAFNVAFNVAEDIASQNDVALVLVRTVNTFFLLTSIARPSPE